MEGRALRPYPPVVVEFDGALTPATVENIDPIVVVWKKRDRRKSKITLPSAADEAVEAGTEYVVRHGPPGFETTTVIGDDTDTTGNFNLDFQGYSRVEFFARRDGYESTIYAFDTIAENGAGASVAGLLATVAVQTNITAAVTVQTSAALPGAVVVTFSDPIDVEIEDMPTITITAPNGGVDVTTDITEYFIVSLSAFDGDVTVGTEANTSGGIDTIDVSGLNTAEVSITVNTSGSIGTVETDNLITVEITADQNAIVSIGTVTLTRVTGAAEGDTAPPETSYSNAGGMGERLTGMITATGNISWASGTYYRLLNGLTVNDCYWGGGTYITWDFSEPRVIDEAKWVQSTASTHGTWQWAGSHDGVSFTDIGGTFTLGGSTTSTMVELNGNTTAYQYYRMTKTAGSLSSDPWLYEIQFKIDDGSPNVSTGTYVQEYGYGDRIGNTTVTTNGTVLTGNVTNSVNGYFAEVADGWRWNSGQTGIYLRFEFDAPQIVNEVKHLSIFTVAAGFYKWQGSNDGSTWDDLTSPYQLNSAVVEYVTLTNTTAYTYYQLVLTSGNTSNSAYNTEFLFRIAS